MIELIASYFVKIMFVVSFVLAFITMLMHIDNPIIITGVSFAIVVVMIWNIFDNSEISWSAFQK